MKPRRTADPSAGWPRSRGDLRRVELCGPFRPPIGATPSDGLYVLLMSLVFVSPVGVSATSWVVVPDVRESAQGGRVPGGHDASTELELSAFEMARRLRPCALALPSWWFRECAEVDRASVANVRHETESSLEDPEHEDDHRRPALARRAATFFWLP